MTYIAGPICLAVGIILLGMGFFNVFQGKKRPMMAGGFVVLLVGILFVSGVFN